VQPPDVEEVSATSSMLVPHAPPSASIVRHRFVDELRARGLPGLVVDDAVLVLSELVGNAVRHGAPLPEGGIRVTWDVGQEAVHLEVADGGRGPLRHEAHAPLAAGGSADAERGRGLAIVSLLTASWGSAFDASCAVVWADIAVRQTAEAQAEQDAEERQEA
jgi:anti-sigma regulatory factor (Ser/Thr protein kinase)